MATPPTIVHLSTCFENRTHADNDQPEKKTQTWWRMLSAWLLSSFVEFHSAVAEKKSKMSEPIRDWGDYLAFSIIQPPPPKKKKKKKLLENVEILLPIKFHWIPFRCSREEVENVWANQRPELPSWFSDLPEKQKMVKDLETLLPVKFHSILFSSCRSQKCEM